MALAAMRRFSQNAAGIDVETALAGQGPPPPPVAEKTAAPVRAPAPAAAPRAPKPHPLAGHDPRVDEAELRRRLYAIFST